MADEILRSEEVGESRREGIEILLARIIELQVAQVAELQDQVTWLEGLLESSRQVNRMWEATARYAIKTLGGNDDTQVIKAYSAAEGYIPQYPR